MANTERLMAIKNTREAMNVIARERLRMDLDSVARQALEEAYDILDRMEDDLIIREVSDITNALLNDSKRLEGISSNIKERIQGLENIAKYIDRAASVVKVLVNVSAQLASFG